MIKCLDYSYKDLILNFLNKEKEKNLYILTNLEFHGFNAPYLRIYGEFDQFNKIIAALFQFNNFFIIYSSNNFSTKEFSDIINANNYTHICGESSILEKLKPFIKFKTIEKSTLCVINNIKSLKTNLNIIQKFQFGDGEKVVNLSNHIKEFPKNIYNSNKLDLDILTERVKGYCVLDNNKDMICMAQLLLNTPFYGIIVGVGTHPDFRLNGYASKCVSKLIKSNYAEGKLFGLTYTSNNAKKMYHSLGFKDICSWSFISN